MKNMICIPLLAGFIFFLFMGSGFLAAHAPDKVTLAFDRKTSSLNVTIKHNVKNPENHYIKRIRVYANGEPVEERSYTSQETAGGHGDVFILKNVKAGDEIMVKATCNKFGGKRANIKIT